MPQRDQFAISRGQQLHYRFNLRSSLFSFAFLFGRGAATFDHRFTSLAIGSAGKCLLAHRKATDMIDRSVVRDLVNPRREFEFGSIRSEEHTSELQSRPHLVCRLLLEKKKKQSKK